MKIVRHRSLRHVGLRDLKPRLSGSYEGGSPDLAATLSLSLTIDGPSLFEPLFDAGITFNLSPKVEEVLDFVLADPDWSDTNKPRFTRRADEAAE